MKMEGAESVKGGGARKEEREGVMLSNGAGEGSG